MTYKLVSQRVRRSRSLLFQEVLAIISTSPNPHGWPHSALQTYWFGYFEDSEQLVPTMVPVSDVIHEHR